MNVKGFLLRKYENLYKEEKRRCCFYKGIYILKMYNNLQSALQDVKWRCRQKSLAFFVSGIVVLDRSCVKLSIWPTASGQLSAHSRICTKDRASIALVAAVPTTYLLDRIQKVTKHSLSFYGFHSLVIFAQISTCALRFSSRVHRGIGRSVAKNLKFKN